ncbi:MAG: hypothetical protein U5N26_06820 [Candidatus Marinimicrobia bacterium]|nr:hypothetical protein [Candidatus Neomarinimicrobiota bacterium]
MFSNNKRIIGLGVHSLIDPFILAPKERHLSAESSIESYWQEVGSYIHGAMIKYGKEKELTKLVKALEDKKDRG